MRDNILTGEQPVNLAHCMLTSHVPPHQVFLAIAMSTTISVCFILLYMEGIMRYIAFKQT